MAEPIREKIIQFLRQESNLYGNVVYVKNEPVPQNDPPNIPFHIAEPVAMKNKAIQPNVKESITSDEKKSHGSVSAHEAWTKAETLDAMNAMICNCMKCPLGATRTKFVFGVGNPHARLMVIGEAPGADEDRQGEPFVGRAGQLLNKILESVRFAREEVFICNILKCRPPGNRDPLPSEEDECVPYLIKQIELVKPRIILALGRVAANRLLGTNVSMKELRTQTNEFQGVPFFTTYHPAALLRNPNWKRDTWEDVQRLRKMYDELTG